jgi:hypothetical protein
VPFLRFLWKLLPFKALSQGTMMVWIWIAWTGTVMLPLPLDLPHLHHTLLLRSWDLMQLKILPHLTMPQCLGRRMRPFPHWLELYPLTPP